MQYHCMNITSNTLNPGQIPVDTADQPIFAPTKELMIRFPDKFGTDKYSCLSGSLHIEKLIICGQVIKVVDWMKFCVHVVCPLLELIL